MKIALVAPPFIPVPPRRYGGTELFIADLADGLTRLGHNVVVYANGESTVSCERRSLYAEGDWPIRGEIHGQLKDLNHTAWALQDAGDRFDVIHVNNATALVFSRFSSTPFFYTVHHPNDPELSDLYAYYPEATYITISHFQRTLERMPKMCTVYHGIDPPRYRLVERKQPYLSFLGRIAPNKGPHLAIEVAKKAGLPLKIAGEIQPLFQRYWETAVKPHVDGRFIEYVGEADLALKNELVGNSTALLFTIQWNEPFGLVMVEAMACGTPVMAFPGGSVAEIVKDGVSGWICRSTDEMAERVRSAGIPPAACRQYVLAKFTLDRMAREYESLYLRSGDHVTAERAAAVQTIHHEGSEERTRSTRIPA